MSEAVGVDLAAAATLEAVVADRLGRVEGLLEVPLLEEAFFVNGARPDAGVAIRLQLRPGRELVRTVGLGG